MTEAEKRDLEKFLNDPEYDNWERIDNGKLSDILYDASDVGGYDLYPDLNSLDLYELFLRTGILPDVILLDKNTIRFPVVEADFNKGITEAISGDYSAESIISDIMNGVNPFDYDLDSIDIYDYIPDDIKEKVNNATPQQKEAIAQEIKREYDNDAYDLWSQEINYNLYDDSDGFKTYNADTEYKDGRVYITIPIDNFINCIGNTTVDTEYSDLCNLLSNGENIAEMLLPNVRKIKEPYWGWFDDIEIDEDYIREFVEDILGE